MEKSKKPAPFFFLWMSVLSFPGYNSHCDGSNDFVWTAIFDRLLFFLFLVTIPIVMEALKKAKNSDSMKDFYH